MVRAHASFASSPAIRIHRFAAAAWLILLACAGCREAPPAASIAPAYDSTGKLRLLTYDSNGDGKPDMWSYMDGSRVVRVEIDSNGDGAIDRREYYGTGQALERAEIAVAYDARFTRTEFYEGGMLARVEEDADGNGAVDKWETYVNGAVSSVAFDTQGTGRPTRRLVYDASGQARVEAVK